MGLREMTERMAAHPRALTPAQARVLLAMRADGPCDGWARSPRVTTLYELEAQGLIRSGKRGWLDTRITAAGIAIRADLLAPTVLAQAAE